ncbi:MAG: hypothetical protein BWY76_02568 [bacterium ADurb.Bin429]|nr:MAG: hypothetical protein BWY76_02568 [bacterium ADurb.Bin429]
MIIATGKRVARFNVDIPIMLCGVDLITQRCHCRLALGQAHRLALVLQITLMAGRVVRAVGARRSEAVI